MPTRNIFAYATTRSQLGRFAFSSPGLAPLVRLTSKPPWMEPIARSDRFACAFLQVTSPTKIIVSSWITCLAMLNPGIPIVLIAPKNQIPALRREFRGRAKSILPASTARAALERKASTLLKVRPSRSSRGTKLTSTERRKVAETILGSMFESSFLIQDGVIIDATLSFFEALGYTDESIIGHHFLEFIPPPRPRRSPPTTPDACPASSRT